MTETTIYLVRHAHAVWTSGEGRGLSPAGRAGAEHVTTLLRGEPIVAVYSSRAHRALQTLEPLAAALSLPLTTIKELRERRLSAEPVADHAAAVAWCWANPEAALSGGESNLMAQQRGVAVITELASRHAGEVIVVGTHGNLLALILQHWQSAVDHAFWSRLTMPDIYALRLGGADASHIARRWDADARFMPPLREAG